MTLEKIIAFTPEEVATIHQFYNGIIKKMCSLISCYSCPFHDSCEEIRDFHDTVNNNHQYFIQS